MGCGIPLAPYSDMGSPGGSDRATGGPVDERLIDGALLVSSSVGFVLGALTVAGVYEQYPPTWHGWVLPVAKDAVWKLPTLVIGSALVILALYVMLRRNSQIRIADWLVIGYAIAIVGAAGLVVSWEMFLQLRARVPQDLGVKTAAVTSLVTRGRDCHRPYRSLDP